MSDLVVWKGPDELRGSLTPLDDLVEMDPNPRRGDPEALARSYDTLGQRKPIVVRAGTVIDGNHQLRACRLLGWSHAATVSADDLSPEEAAAYAIAANRTAQLGSIDYDELSAAISKIDTELASVTGYSDAEIAKLVEYQDRQDFYVGVSDDPVETTDIQTDTECPKCGFCW